MRRRSAMRLARWAGVVLIGLLIGVTLVSSAYKFRWIWENDAGRVAGVTLIWGCVRVWHDDSNVWDDAGVFVERVPGYRLQWRFEDLDFRWMPDSARQTSIPLWWPMAGIALPTAILWAAPMFSPIRRRAARLAKGLCPTCKYALDASRAGCPECGWNRHSTGTRSLADKENRE